MQIPVTYTGGVVEPEQLLIISNKTIKLNKTISLFVASKRIFDDFRPQKEFCFIRERKVRTKKLISRVSCP